MHPWQTYKYFNHLCIKIIPYFLIRLFLVFIFYCLYFFSFNSIFNLSILPKETSSTYNYSQTKHPSLIFHHKITKVMKETSYPHKTMILPSKIKILTILINKVQVFRSILLESYAFILVLETSCAGNRILPTLYMRT